MAAKPEEITGVFLKEFVRRGNWAVGEIELPEPPVGMVANLFTGGNTARISGEWLPNIADPDTGERPPESETLQLHRTYRFYGRWESHAKYGKQFVFKTFVESQPFGRLGVISYLSRAPGIGQATAAKLWEIFKSDAPRIVRESPDVAVAAVNAPYFTEARATEAAEYLEKHVKLEATTIELHDLFLGRGFRHKLPLWLINGLGLTRRGYGNRAAEEVKADPYLLLNYPGCGFLRTDAFYLSLGHDPRSIRRQSLAAWHHLHIDNNGHTWFPVEYAAAGIRAKVGGAEIDPPAAFVTAKENDLLAFRRDDSKRLWAAEFRAAEQEKRIAECTAQLLDPAYSGPSEWPQLDESDGLSSHQAEEWAKATVSHLGLFTGYGGTGKTYVIARAVGRILGQFGFNSIALCAPTWAAANRMTESLAEYEIDFSALSIHSLLGFRPNSQGEWDFSHGDASKLPFRFIICDEASMPGTPIFSSLISAVGRGAHLLLVGDTGQLPPVDHGAPMRDLLSAGLPRGELTEVRRNAGTLANSLTLVRKGKAFPTDDRIDLAAESPLNFRWLEESDPEKQIALAVKVFKCAEAEGRNIAWDVKAVCATNKTGPLGRENLNNVLQCELNKTGTKIGSNPFMVGDPIVKHGMRQSFSVDKKRQGNIPYKADEDDKVSVTNREQGEVVEVAENMTVVKLMRGKSPIFIKVPRGKERKDADDDESASDASRDKLPDTGCQWTLAYAITVHIAQGGQWPVVITMVDGNRICDRSWYYTAFSRAMKLQVAIGRKSTAIQMLKTVKIDKRKTFLKELILEAMAKTGESPQLPPVPTASEPVKEKFGTRVPYPPILNGTEAAHVNRNH